MTDRAKKLNREEKLQLQAEKLKEQAQIDLEGYVMCRSALRATRTDLQSEVIKEVLEPDKIKESENDMTEEQNKQTYKHDDPHNWTSPTSQS